MSDSKTTADENIQAPRLDDPTMQAIGYAEALAGLVRSQQKRIEVLMREIDRLDGVIADLQVENDKLRGSL